MISPSRWPSPRAQVWSFSPNSVQKIYIDFRNFFTSYGLQIFQGLRVPFMYTWFEVLSKRKESHIDMFGVWKDQRMSLNREMIRFGNKIRIVSVETLAVCAVSSAYWNRRLCLLIRRLLSFGSRKLSNVFLSYLTLTTIRHFIHKQINTNVPHILIALQNVSLELRGGFSWTGIFWV